MPVLIDACTNVVDIENVHISNAVTRFVPHFTSKTIIEMTVNYIIEFGTL